MKSCRGQPGKMVRQEFKTRVLTRLRDLQTIAAEWRELFDHCPDATPFQHPAWILSWIEVFAPNDLFVIEVRRENSLVGVAPLLVYQRDGERVLVFAAGGVSDYLDVLADPAWECEVLFAILEALQSLSNWTTLDFTDLHQSSLLNRTALAQFAAPHDDCSTLALPRTRSELLHILSKRQRANLRNARSRLQRIGGGTIEFATANSLPEFLDDLFRLHTTRWFRVGGPGVLADEIIRAFHRVSAPKLLAEGILHLARLRVNGRSIATLYSLWNHSTVFCYLQGFDPEFAYVSPGTQLMFSAIEHAVDSGIRKFDFLRGEETYKRHWRADHQFTYRIQLPRLTLRSVISVHTIAG